MKTLTSKVIEKSLKELMDLLDSNLSFDDYCKKAHKLDNKFMKDYGYSIAKILNDYVEYNYIPEGLELSNTFEKQLKAFFI